MTEISENNRYIIDPVAFVGALIGAPLLFTAATFWVLYIPLFALAIGGIPYLIIGTPVLMIHLRRNPVRSGDVAWVAVLSSSAVLVVGACILSLQNPHEASGILAMAAVIWAFATVFSAAWGATFGWLYAALARDFYIDTVTA